MGRHASAACVIALVAACSAAGSAAPAVAQVTSSVTTNTYSVPGTTAKSIVRYMQSHPIRGDHGSAFANIRPRYTLTLDSAERGGMCRATEVRVKIHFTLTVPEASQKSRMSGRVRSAWNSFSSFIRSHEDQHRRSYIGCAESFVREAKREKAASCFAIESAIRRLFDRMKRDCEARQVAWDKTQKGRLKGQTLVRMAGY